MILVDSNFFIALINEKDQYHKRAIGAEIGRASCRERV